MKPYESKPFFLARAAMKCRSSVVGATPNTKNHAFLPIMMPATFAPCYGQAEANQFSLPILVAE